MANKENKDLRCKFYGSLAVSNIEKYLETKAIEYITELYEDINLRNKIIEVEAQEKNRNYLKNYPRLYPFIDSTKENSKVYLRYWPKESEAMDKINKFSTQEIENFLAPFRRLKNGLTIV